MVSKLNKNAYEQLIQEDIDWLEKHTEDTLEQNHIIAVLKDSVRFYYPAMETRGFTKPN